MSARDVELRARALVEAAHCAAGDLVPREAHAARALVERALRLLSPLDEPERRAIVLDALVLRGRALAALDAEDAVAAHAEIVRRFSESDLPGARGRVILALVDGARLLVRRGQHDAGAVWAMRAIRVCGGADDAAPRQLAGSAVDVLRAAVRARTRFDGAALERATIDRLARARSVGASVERTRLLVAQADALGSEGQLLDALGALDEALGCLDDLEEPSADPLRADVVVARARIMQRAGYHRAALEGLDLELDGPRFCPTDEQLIRLHVLRGSLSTMLGADEEAVLAFLRALEVDPSRERPWVGAAERQLAVRACGILEVVERLDLKAVLLCHQAGLVGPTHLAAAARRALADGVGGEATCTAAFLDQRPPDAAVDGLRAVAAGLRAELGLPEHAGAAGVTRARLELCAAILAGGDAIALGWTIAATELLEEAPSLSSGFIRALTRSYPGIVTDDEVALELVCRARRTLARAPYAGAEAASGGSA